MITEGTIIDDDISAIADISPDKIAGTAVTLSGNETLSNKVLADAVLNISVTGSGVLDEDTMESDSNTKLSTQQSIKAYADNSIDDIDIILLVFPLPFCFGCS